MRVQLVPGLGIRPSVGGQGSFCRYLATGLRDFGVDVVIASDDPEWGTFGQKESIETRLVARFGDVDVVHVNSKNRKVIARALLARRPVVVTHQDYHLACPAGSAYTARGCSAGPAAGPCANCPRRSLRARVELRAYRALAASRNVRHVGISDCVRRRLELPRSTAILSPQPLLDLTESDADGRLVAFAGRLAPVKGVPLVLKALTDVADARLEIAGEGECRSQLEALAGQLGIAHRVRFLGQVSLEGVRELYSRAAVVVVPSLYDEPFGYSAAEAMALGKATVASRAGAFREMLDDDRGWLCSTTDVGEWVKALREALDNPDERERRGARARAFVAEVLSPSFVARRYHDVYLAADAR